MKEHRSRKRKRGVAIGPNSASKALDSVLNRYGAAREIREHRILIYWDQIVGEKVGAHTTPDALKKSVLWVRVDSSSWMHQLSFLKDGIMDKANQLCGQKVVEDIRFHLGRPKERSYDAIAAAARIRRSPLRQRKLPSPAIGEQLHAIENEAASIEDKELREAIIDVRRRLNL